MRKNQACLLLSMAKLVNEFEISYCHLIETTYFFF